jgi:hypothetical protein
MKLIKIEIMDGAKVGSGKGVNHLTMMSTTIYPKVQEKKSISGTKTKKNLDQLLKEIQLIPFRIIPRII